MDHNLLCIAGNIFSTIMFVQECLKRFGEPEDKFVLVYREKDEKENKQVYEDITSNEELVQLFNGYRNPYPSYACTLQKILSFEEHREQVNHILQRKLQRILLVMDMRMTTRCFLMNRRSRLNLCSFIQVMTIRTLLKD